MKVGLLERIRAVGHWRLNLQPLRPIPARLSFQQCQEIVERNRVSIRGWDFPHVSHRDDDQGGITRGAEYVESWCDWREQIEFWRMYRSGQFLSYNVLSEDFLHGFQGRPADGPFLDVVDTTYTVTEFVEFALRLISTGVLGDGLNLDLTLQGATGRFLWTGGRRIPFFERKSTEAEAVRVRRELPLSAWSDGAVKVSNSILLEIFDHFGWNPAAEQIQGDQESFYRREFM